MANTLSKTGNRLRTIQVSGKTLSTQLTNACISASLSASISQVTELKLKFQDSADTTLFRGNKLKPGTTITYGPWSTRVSKVKAAPGKAGPTLEVTALSRGVAKLRASTGSKSWGNRDVAAWVKQQAKAAGFKSTVVQPGLGKRKIVREKPTKDKKESTWDVLTDLSKELGVWLFEHGNTLYFAKPTWLVARPSQTILSLSWTDWDSYHGAMAGMPEYSKDEDADLKESLKVKLISKDADYAKPGQTLKMGGSGAGSMKGTWIVTSVDLPLDITEPVVLSCQRAINPEKQPKKTTTAKKKSTAGTKKKSTGKTVKGKTKTSSLKANAGAKAALDSFARRYNGARLDFDGGYGAQCVDLAKAWNQLMVKGPVVRGNGKDWYRNCARSGAYISIPRSGKARAGDIFSMDGSWGGGYGHVGIVVEDLGGSLRTFDQLNGRTGYHTLSKRGLIGYSRPKKWR